MAHQVAWNKIIVETFIEEAMLSKTEEWILRTRVAEWTIKEQAQKLNMSEDNVNKIIARLKKKYDMVSKYNPLLPPRKTSAKETWMDNN